MIIASRPQPLRRLDPSVVDLDATRIALRGDTAGRAARSSIATVFAAEVSLLPACPPFSASPPQARPTAATKPVLGATTPAPVAAVARHLR